MALLRFLDTRLGDPSEVLYRALGWTEAWVSLSQPLHCPHELVTPRRLPNPLRAAAPFFQTRRPQALVAPQPLVERRAC